MIYVDWPAYRYGNLSRQAARHGRIWCHLWADPGNEAELHAFAARLGLQREWFQDRRDFPHYDLTEAKFAAARALGAAGVDLKAWLRRQAKLANPPPPCMS